MQEIQGFSDSGNHLATTWQPTGNHLATQDRLGKDSIGEVSVGKSSVVKDSIGEKEEEKEEKSPTTNTCKQVAALFNQICVSYPSPMNSADDWPADNTSMSIFVVISNLKSILYLLFAILRRFILVVDNFIVFCISPLYLSHTSFKLIKTKLILLDFCN